MHRLILFLAISPTGLDELLMAKRFSLQKKSPNCSACSVCRCVLIAFGREVGAMWSMESWWRVVDRVVDRVVGVKRSIVCTN